MPIGYLTKTDPLTGLEGRVVKLVGGVLGWVQDVPACVALCCGAPTIWRADPCPHPSPCPDTEEPTIDPVYFYSTMMADDLLPLLADGSPLPSRTFLYDAGMGEFCYTAVGESDLPAGAHLIPADVVVSRVDGCDDTDCPAEGFVVQGLWCNGGSPPESDYTTCLALIPAGKCMTYRAPEGCVEFKRTNPMIPVYMADPDKIVGAAQLTEGSCCQCGSGVECLTASFEVEGVTHKCCCGRLATVDTPTGAQVVSLDCTYNLSEFYYRVSSLLGGGTEEWRLKANVVEPVNKEVYAVVVHTVTPDGGDPISDEYEVTFRVTCDGQLVTSLGATDLESSCGEGFAYVRQCARNGGSYNRSCSPGSPPATEYEMRWTFTVTCDLSRPCLKCSGQNSEDGDEDSGGEDGGGALAMGGGCEGCGGGLDIPGGDGGGFA